MLAVIFVVGDVSSSTCHTQPRSCRGRTGSTGACSTTRRWRRGRAVRDLVPGLGEGQLQGPGRRSSSKRAWGSSRRSRRSPAARRRPGACQRGKGQRAAALEPPRAGRARRSPATNSRQRACSAARQAASRPGSTVRSTGGSAAASASDSNSPAPTAASAAAPSTVASAPAASAGAPIASAWSSSIRGSLVSPPSTRRLSTSTLSRIASTTSATRQAMPSSAARATWARGGAPADPGEHRPSVRAPPGRADPGESRQHPRASRVVGLARQRAERRRGIGESELAAEPLEHRPGGEDAAVERVLGPAVDHPGDRRQQATCGLGDLFADVGKDEDAGPVGGLDPAGHDGAGPGEGRLLVDGLTAEREARPASAGGPGCRARRRSRGSRAGPPAGRRRSRRAGVEARGHRSAGAGCARRSRGRWRSRRRGGRRGTRRRSPCEGCRASWASATASSCSSSQASLAAEKYGSNGSPLARLDLGLAVGQAGRVTSCERLSCQTTIGLSGRPLSASQASTDSPWWSSPQATTSPGASVSTSAIASTTAESTSSPSCSTHPGCGWRLTFSRRASRTGRSSRSKSAALTPVVPSSTPSSSCSAIRPSGPARAGVDIVRPVDRLTPMVRSTNHKRCREVSGDPRRAQKGVRRRHRRHRPAASPTWRDGCRASG